MSGTNSQELLEYLLKRRSASVKDGLSGPAPDAAQLDCILTAAARVPDHGKTCPFYFLVFEGEARAEIGEKIAAVFSSRNPNAPAEKIEVERKRFLRAPLVIGVVYRARQAKHPLWEQMMSAGAACQNLILAANASGFGAQWLTEWYAYDPDVRAALGLDGRDVVAGFIHIGQPPAVTPEDRDRPDLERIVTRWSCDATVQKGDIYDREKFEIPPLGFSVCSFRP